MFMAGRLISVPLSARFSSFSLILLSITVAITALAAIVTTPATEQLLSVAAAAMGLSLASVFPSAINFGKSAMGTRGLKASELSLLMLSGTAGGAALPWCCGYVLRSEINIPLAPAGPSAMMTLLLVVTLASAAGLLAAGAAIPSTAKAKTN